MAYLCSGNTRANPSALSIFSQICAGRWLMSMSLGTEPATAMR